MRQEGEPSVEEILDSIKRVMERDRAEASEFVQRNRAPENLDHVLAPEPAPEPVDEDEANEILDLGEAGATIGDDSDIDGRLTNEDAADAMRQSLAALAMLSEPPAKPQIVRQGETSLEGMVREMLRPMMAQWLDANLPGIVERMVKAEISRIAGKKR